MIHLAIIGGIEAVIHLLRYRSAVGKSALWSAATTFLLCAARVVFLAAGVALVVDGEPVWAALLAYAGPAAVVTLALHWWLERRARHGG